jgi:hypothetical protein
MTEKSIKNSGILLCLVTVVVLAFAFVHEQQQAKIMTKERDSLRSQVAELNDQIIHSGELRTEPDQKAPPLQDSVLPPVVSSNKNLTEINETPAENPANLKNSPDLTMDQIRTDASSPILGNHSQRAILNSNNNQPRYTREQLELYRCANQMYEINLAIAHWAMDHNGVIPKDLSELEGYISPMTLICPSVQPTSLAVSWKNFDKKDITYRLDPGARGALWDFPNPNRPSPGTKRCLYCPIHNIDTFNQVMAGGIPIDQLFRP